MKDVVLLDLLACEHARLVAAESEAMRLTAELDQARAQLAGVCPSCLTPAGPA